MVRLAAALLVSGIFSIGVAAAQPAPAVNWNGAYGGIVAGYAWGNSRHCDFGDPCPAVSAVHNIAGALGGLTLGYNMQRGLWVFGIEGDIAAANIDNSSPTRSAGGFACVGGCITEVHAIGTLRGRLGYAVGRFLPYVTAGVGFANIEGTLIDPFLGNGSKIKTSFVYGIGVETVIAANWTAKLEFIRAEDFGSFQYDTAGACGATRCYIDTVELNMVKIGLNYRFGR